MDQRSTNPTSEAEGHMTLQDFTGTLRQTRPPTDCPLALAALWYDAKGDWEKAHRIAQDIDDPWGAWVHAYLHRKEGDSGNALYWYRRACRTFATEALPDEWERIVTSLLVGERDMPEPVGDGA
jgi:hypothetical protein